MIEGDEADIKEFDIDANIGEPLTPVLKSYQLNLYNGEN